MRAKVVALLVSNCKSKQYSARIWSRAFHILVLFWLVSAPVADLPSLYFWCRLSRYNTAVVESCSCFYSTAAAAVAAQSGL